MENTRIIKEFEDAQAILKGHFKLSSGLHSDTYLQCARVLMDPARADRLCGALADKIRAHIPAENFPQYVVAPAMGGVIVGYEIARQLNLPSMFCERVDGEFTLRRGFHLPEGAKVLVVEDVVTTGKSSLETFDCIREYGAEIIAEASLVNRSGKEAPIGDIPLISLISLDVKSYDAENLPEELRDIPIEKPGSRFLKS